MVSLLMLKTTNFRTTSAPKFKGLETLLYLPLRIFLSSVVVFKNLSRIRQEKDKNCKNNQKIFELTKNGHIDSYFEKL